MNSEQVFPLRNGEPFPTSWYKTEMLSLFKTETCENFPTTETTGTPRSWNFIFRVRLTHHKPWIILILMESEGKAEERYI